MNDIDYKRLPPQSIDAEKAVLGCILINNESISDILEYLSYDSFYDNATGDILPSSNTIKSKYNIPKALNIYTTDCIGYSKTVNDST